MKSNQSWFDDMICWDWPESSVLVFKDAGLGSPMPTVFLASTRNSYSTHALRSTTVAVKVFPSIISGTKIKHKHKTGLNNIKRDQQTVKIIWTYTHYAYLVLLNMYLYWQPASPQWKPFWLELCSWGWDCRCPGPVSRRAVLCCLWSPPLLCCLEHQGDLTQTNNFIYYLASNYLLYKWTIIQGLFSIKNLFNKVFGWASNHWATPEPLLQWWQANRLEARRLPLQAPLLPRRKVLTMDNIE